ncbi:MAG: hypothetical protein ACYTHJ_10395 [Planctomycetota bacterium]
MKDPFTLNPQQITVGMLSPNDETKHLQAKIYRGNGGPIAPELDFVPTDQVDVKITEVVAGQEYDLDITLSPPWKVGTFRHSIGLRTGVKEAPRRGFMVMGSVLPRIMPAPKYLWLPANIKAGTRAVTTLRWNHGDPGEVLETSCTIPGATITMEPDKSGQKLTLHVPPSKDPFSGGHKLLVKTDDPDVPELEIPINVRRRGKSASRNETIGRNSSKTGVRGRQLKVNRAQRQKLSRNKANSAAQLRPIQPQPVKPQQVKPQPDKPQPDKPQPDKP